MDTLSSNLLTNIFYFDKRDVIFNNPHLIVVSLFCCGRGVVFWLLSHSSCIMTGGKPALLQIDAYLDSC